MRLFLALELPDRLRAAVAEAQDRLRAGEPGWRFLRPQALHLTLRFLGEVPQGCLPELSPRFAAASASAAPADLEVSGLGAFPPRGRPRVLWIGVRDRSGGALAALAGALEAEARAAGFSARERVGVPHLTVARVAAGGRPRRPEAVVPALGAFRAEEVTLFRSVPGRGGAAYTALARYPIGRALGWTP